MEHRGDWGESLLHDPQSTYVKGFSFAKTALAVIEGYKVI
jgi:hypothetical protein